MKKIKFDFIWFCITFMAGVIVTIIFMSACMKSVTRELEKVQHELEVTKNQRDILSDIIRCHTDEEVENCDIMDVADDFLPAIGCSKDSLAEWTYCY